MVCLILSTRWVYSRRKADVWLRGWFRATSTYSLMQRNCFTPAMRISAGSLSLLRLQVGARGPRGARSQAAGGSKQLGAQSSLSSKPVPSSSKSDSPSLLRQLYLPGAQLLRGQRRGEQHTGELTTHGGAHNPMGPRDPRTLRTVREQLGLDDKQRLANTRKRA